MKTMVVVVMMVTAVMVVAGCGTARYTSDGQYDVYGGKYGAGQTVQPQTQPAKVQAPPVNQAPTAPPVRMVQRPVAGTVPVVFINQSEYYSRRVVLFEGSSRVDPIPDARTGGWMYNRQSFKEFEVGRARDVTWEAWEDIQLPRNSEFVAVVTALNVIGAESSEFNTVYFRTGSHPSSVAYNRRTPYGERATAGAVVYLPAIYPAHGSGQIALTVNPGAHIKAGLGAIFGAIFGGGQ